MATVSGLYCCLVKYGFSGHTYEHKLVLGHKIRRRMRGRLCFLTPYSCWKILLDSFPFSKHQTHGHPIIRLLWPWPEDRDFQVHYILIHMLQMFAFVLWIPYIFCIVLYCIWDWTHCNSSWALWIFLNIIYNFVICRRMVANLVSRFYGKDCIGNNSTV